MPLGIFSHQIHPIRVDSCLRDNTPEFDFLFSNTVHTRSSEQIPENMQKLQLIRLNSLKKVGKGFSGFLWL